MPSNKNDCDVVSLVVGVVVFALPLALLAPGVSVWEVLPKVHITRCHIFEQYLSWPQLNAAVVTLLVLCFCIYLEIRKRLLDEMVESALTVSQATDAAMREERERQSEAIRACVQLLDTSVDHYENLILLRDDLRKRDAKQHPPVIELSASDL